MAAESSPPSPVEGAKNRRIRIGKYEVTKHIATGGMGAVYRALDTEDQTEVALKVLPPETAAKPALLERFRREARSASKLQHDNIVRVFEFGEVGATYYLAMEFVDGVDLHDYVKRKGQLPPEEARQIILQGARALRHADEHSIVHRDIKPSNFLLTQKNNKPLVKLTDFGLAREVNADDYRVTRAGTTVGTIDYMSPEQARDSSSADIRSDLYSLGTTWFHLLTGQAPFPEGGLGERLIKIMQEPPPDVCQLNPRISTHTRDVLLRLLAKDPRDRYQTPDELIDALLDLEGRSTATGPSRLVRPVGRSGGRSGEVEEAPAAKPKSQPKPSSSGTKKKPSKKKRPSSTATEAPITVADAPSHTLRNTLIGLVVVALAVVGGVVAFAHFADDSSPGPRPDITQPVPGSSLPPPEVEPKTPEKDKDQEKEKSKEKEKDPPYTIKTPTKPITKAKWPTLPGVRIAEIDAKALQAEISAPWRTGSPAVDPQMVFKAVVRRSPGADTGVYRTLTEAFAAAPAGKRLEVEIADSGPMFALPPPLVEGRDVVLRAAAGHRPLLIWDIPQTLKERFRLSKTKAIDAPLAFLNVRGGSLTLEGLEVACRWPDTIPDRGWFVDVAEGDLTLRNCTFSLAGKPRSPFTLARQRATKAGARCLVRQCQLRGADLQVLDLDAPESAVWIDGSLLAAGKQSAISLRGGDKATQVFVTRSTLIGGQALVDVKPLPGADANPALKVIAWDSVLARAGEGEGDLLVLREKAAARNVTWRGVNSLYAGWKNLLSCGELVAGDNLQAWRVRMGASEGDHAVLEAWPAGRVGDPAGLSPTVYAADPSVGFVSSWDREKPIGCDLAALPWCRNGWQDLAFDPTITPVEFPADDQPPEIPAPGDGKYHGGRLESLESIDLGKHLAQFKGNLGPRVVLILAGKGESSTSPIKIEGSTLVLYFEPPNEKDPPLLLRLLTKGTSVPMIDVSGGGLEITNGRLRVPDADTVKVTYMARVAGGDVKLFRTRFEGPQQKIAPDFQGVLHIQGSGDTKAESARKCLLNECLMVSNQAAITVEGVGCRVGVQQSALVAKSDALLLQSGAACKDKAAIQVSLEDTTIAAGRSAVYLGDVPGTEVVTEPILVQSRNCAYLNPFVASVSAGKTKAGLVMHEGEAFSRGLLLWQGKRETFDSRLHYAVWPSSTGFPTKASVASDWLQTWGSSGYSDPRSEVQGLQAFNPTNAWVLYRLKLPQATEMPGANLQRLGIKAK